MSKITLSGICFVASALGFFGIDYLTEGFKMAAVNGLLVFSLSSALVAYVLFMSWVVEGK